MSSNFDPIRKNQSDWVSKHFNCSLPDSEWKDSTYINDVAPFVYLENGTPKCDLGNLGLIPPWSSNKKKHGAFSYAVKSETINENGMYKMPWLQRKFGLVLANSFYEPLYEDSGSKFVPSPIFRAIDEPMGIACIWDSFQSRATGEVIRSFSLITMNVEKHPVLNRFYKPKDEKRSVVVIETGDFHKWLNATHDQAKELIKLCPDDYLRVIS